MIRNKAVVIRLHGDADMSAALALAAVSPELKALQAENAEYRRKLELEEARRWKRNGEKLASYTANIKPAPWPMFALVAGWAILCKVWGFFMNWGDLV